MDQYNLCEILSQFVPFPMKDWVFDSSQTHSYENMQSCKKTQKQKQVDQAND